MRYDYMAIVTQNSLTGGIVMIYKTKNPTFAGFYNLYVI